MLIWVQFMLAAGQQNIERKFKHLTHKKQVKEVVVF